MLRTSRCAFGSCRVHRNPQRNRNIDAIESDAQEKQAGTGLLSMRKIKKTSDDFRRTRMPK